MRRRLLLTTALSTAFARVASAQWGNSAQKTLYGGKSESLPGTVVNTLGSSTTTIAAGINASQTPGTPVGPLNVIGINSAGNILVNSGSGFVNVGGISVIELYYASDHTCYQENSSLNWYGPVDASTTGTAVTNPIPLINSITATPVSNSPGSYPSTGVEVATLAAAVSGINYATFHGTFSIAAGSASGFSINNSVSPPQILTNGVAGSGSYNLNITATQTGLAAGVAVPPFTTPSPLSVTVGTSAIQAPFAIRLGESLGQGGGTEGSISAHMAAVKSQIAIPKVVGAVIINSYQDGFALPSQWGGDVGVWTTGNGLPVDGSMVPQLDGHFTNGTSTDCDYAGVIAGTYDTPLINAFNLWKALAPFPMIYFRINWEFNTNFRGWGVPSSGQVSAWVSAYKHWANVLHTWGNQPGNPKVRMVWSPDTTYTNAESTTFSLPVINFFPQPDGSAVNGRYIDVIGSDNYMNGWGVNGASNLNQGFTTPLASNTNWSLGTFAKMAQTYGCNLGISETGDGPIFDNNASATNGVMSGWANFLNTLQTLSPTVPIEYLTLYDVSDGTADQQSGVGNFPIQCEGWNCAFGNAATQPGGPVIPQIMTIPPI